MWIAQYISSFVDSSGAATMRTDTEAFEMNRMSCMVRKCPPWIRCQRFVKVVGLVRIPLVTLRPIFKLRAREDILAELGVLEQYVKRHIEGDDVVQKPHSRWGIVITIRFQHEESLLHLPQDSLVHKKPKLIWMLVPLELEVFWRDPHSAKCMDLSSVYPPTFDPIGLHSNREGPWGWHDYRQSAAGSVTAVIIPYRSQTGA